MEKVIADVTSLHWWISVVFTTFILNVFSEKLWRLISTLLEKLSKKWTSLKSKNRQRFAYNVQILATEPDLKNYLSTKELRIRARALNFMIMALFLVVIVQYLRSESTTIVLGVLTLAALISTIASIADLKKARRISILLDASDHNEKIEKFTQD
jgi:predicted branched-subunit amino acid permease